MGRNDAMDALTAYQAYTAPFQGSRRYHTWAIIAVMSGLLERRVWLARGGIGNLHPNQYIILCGRAGSGKTVAGDIATKLLKDYNASIGKDKGIAFGPDKFTPAALFKRFKQKMKVVDLPGGKTEHSALLLYSTELGTMIKDIGGGSVVEDFLKLYDCSDTFDKELVNGGQILINGPCLNFLACTTPAFLSSYLPREQSQVGFTSRIVFANDPSNIPMDSYIPAGDPDLKALLLSHFGRMHRLKGEFRFDAGGQALYGTWFRATREKLFSMPDNTFMSNFYARKPDHACKVSMAISAGMNSNKIITEEILARAISIIDEAEPTMNKSFGVKDFKKVDDAIKTIVDGIPWHPHETAHSTLVQNLFYEGLSGEERQMYGYLQQLISGEMITVRNDPTKTERFYSRRK